MKYLRVLLTKYPGRFSRLLALLSGRGFTHASIGLEGDGRFYSFSFRGFTEETPDKLRRRGVTAGRCYRIPVTDGAYRLAEARLRAMPAGRTTATAISGWRSACCASPSTGKTAISAPSLWRSFSPPPGPSLCGRPPRSTCPTIFRRSWTECAR